MQLFFCSTQSDHSTTFLRKMKDDFHENSTNFQKCFQLKGSLARPARQRGATQRSPGNAASSPAPPTPSPSCRCPSVKGSRHAQHIKGCVSLCLGPFETIFTEITLAFAAVRRWLVAAAAEARPYCCRTAR